MTDKIEKDDLVMKVKSMESESEQPEHEMQNKKDQACGKEEDKSEAQEKNIDYKLKFMQIAADFANFKRRMEEERADWGYLAQSDIIFKLLPFVDDLDRAIMAGEKIKDCKEKEAWFDGFKLVQKNLKKILDDLQVQKIDCSSDFDPQYHEALMQVESKEKKSGEIVDVIEAGYTFKDKVLKHAKVSVAK